MLHREVAETLRRRFKQGLWLPGTKLPSLRALAAEFGVSTITVGRALRTLEQENLLQHVAGVGVLAGGRGVPATALATRTVAFCAADLGSLVDMGVARGIARACQDRGWTLQLLDAGYDLAREARNLRQVRHSGVQGAIILATCDPQSVDALFELQAGDLPVVLVDRTPHRMRTDLVESDHEQGAYRATQYLLERGHRQVLWLADQPIVSSVAARLHGYERALTDASLRPRADWKIRLNPRAHAEGVRRRQPWLGGYTAMVPVLKTANLPLAVFAVDSNVGWGVYEACRELGLRIPEDVSVIAFDDTEATQALKPAMTVVAQRTEELGEAAVELLERRILLGPAKSSSRQVFTHMVIETEIRERQSVQVIEGGELSVRDDVSAHAD